MGFKEIGKKLQQAREEAGLSQEQLASQMGCAQSTLSNYEKGKRRIYLTQLETIAGLLNKPIEYFLESSNNANSSGSSTTGINNIDDVFDGEPELLQIVNALYELPRDKRRSVMDYIIWQKDR